MLLKHLRLELMEQPGGLGFLLTGVVCLVWGEINLRRYTLYTSTD
jgi:hypothetical protein